MVMVQCVSLGRWLLRAVGATALLLAACGGGDPAAPPSAATVTAAPAVVDAASAVAQATIEAAGNVATAASDGLTGAPVPAPTAPTREFDADRFNARGGSFPPLDDPAVVSAEAATWMEADALVLGAVQNGEARAYPLFMMTFHHVANDELGGEPYLVTF